MFLFFFSIKLIDAYTTHVLQKFYLIFFEKNQNNQFINILKK